jgi:hypothetical protein
LLVIETTLELERPDCPERVCGACGRNQLAADMTLTRGTDALVQLNPLNLNLKPSGGKVIPVQITRS